jgi:hypothetical protein
MAKYHLAFTKSKPQSWHAIGEVSKEHALNQFKAFGFVIKKDGVLMLDYENVLNAKKLKKDTKDA